MVPKPGNIKSFGYIGSLIVCIDKIKARRKAVRSTCTKFVNKVKSFLEIFNSQNEAHQEQLFEYLLNLDAKQIELRSLNKEDFLSYEELFKAEIEGSLEYEENINEVKYRVKSKINKIHLSQPDVNSKGANESNVRTNNYALSLNLPKLRIPNFSGDSSNYLEFVNNFTNAIDANESLSNVDKFIYLKSFLSGEASKNFSGFALTGDNYKSCFWIF
ncbi:uncharacterized protein TNIN_258601 [Trichonephila inaurata madagascariensis]|uniref:Uncharacterized protein n=1 Tax=Trichonephila inaurata madagascariensis TaxID=2747483 RepID=A0A8X6WZD2_9ARAC|nr:uncharacterized protein TNIN_258601 [Trichonephila inaurata madagascariensis]